ncbi:MAG TPA: hypothetical protein PKK74_06550 [Candidatus Methanoculleus thermohydrogenotrophicum]|jgi:hypothetical protein|nr:hypothetical protein [Candidatus Methanoculleus thermohydrogenotrophicum]HOB18336.1 hypothetical protein [Candidatus Methanoculleus thermohydrogenotrophicum]HPZ37823.1 hypothetical protein [Candidatus Methanoculleus thermohydrogenotrophicum]HQC91049.1 hypothetical protein [Candidatus Methanoculleus thermohydrogenotrophicum]
MRVDLAFKAFFRRVKAGEKPGTSDSRERDGTTVSRILSLVFEDLNIKNMQKKPFSGKKHCG